MKFYKDADVQVLIEALKTCEHEGDIINTLEAFAKIEPVSVPEFDRQLAAEKERRTFWFRDGAEWENERIRKHMEGEK